MRRRRTGAPAEAHYEPGPAGGPKRRRFSFPHFTGRFLALATLGGALAGYPLFLWLDPLAIFGGFFNVLHLSASTAALLSIAALPIVMLISYFMPGTWCPRVCPLGAAQELLALVGGALRRIEVKAPEADWKSTLAGRRSFLAVSIGAVAPVLISDGSAADALPLRPPGSVDEKSYKGDCIRCGSCVRACPTGIIEPAADLKDLPGLLAPGLRFDGLNYCLQDCNLCGQVCPTGVIQPLELEPKNEHVIGIAEIDLSACLLVLDQECGVCVPRCPRAAIDEVFSPETYTTIVRVVPERCNGCGACVGICPEKVVKVVASPCPPSPSLIR
jgi:ferredoxin-type protein NapF